MVRWIRYTIGGWLVNIGIAMLPKEPDVERALYKWISNSHLHRVITTEVAARRQSQ